MILLERFCMQVKRSDDDSGYLKYLNLGTRQGTLKTLSKVSQPDFGALDWEQSYNQGSNLKCLELSVGPDSFGHINLDGLSGFSSMVSIPMIEFRSCPQTSVPYSSVAMVGMSSNPRHCASNENRKQLMIPDRLQGPGEPPALQLGAF